jgi:Fumarylacetoacetate (FAA) hydrolase family/short chain dehydrogenase
LNSFYWWRNLITDVCHCITPGPIGPVIVTSDELTLEKVHNLKIACRVNGETLQDSNTSNLIHKVDALVAWLSKFMTLYPGDLVATGTPPGVGCFRKPPRWLKPGDVVECEIEQIGTLVSPIVATLAPSPASTSLIRTSRGRLEGRVCIVTGGARGIGFGIASHFGLEGAAVVVVVDLNQDDVEAAAKKLQLISPSCKYQGLACDVTNTVSVQKVWDQVASTHGRLEVVVQAAGIVGETNLKCENVNPDNFDAGKCRKCVPRMLYRFLPLIIAVTSYERQRQGDLQWMQGSVAIHDKTRIWKSSEYRIY